MSTVKAIPDGYPIVIPYLYVKGAAKAIEFYKNVFGAVEKVRMPGPNESVGHAELTFGDSMVMLSDEHPQMGALGPQSVGGSPVTLHVYAADVDAVVQKAVAAGATLDRPVKNQFYGDRTGLIIDPFGHKWYVATHVEDVSPEEMKKRMAAVMGQAAGGVNAD
jgi:PhnB protein